MVNRYTCVLKSRDERGNIIDYTLKDENGNIEIVTAGDIKAAIGCGRIIIDNLQIDKVGRLVHKKVQTKKLGMEKSVDLIKCMESNLIMGRAVTIPKIDNNQIFTPKELHNYVPKDLIKPMFKVLENAPTGSAIRNMCETLVPMAVRNVESKGYKVKKSMIQSHGIDVEIYEIIEISK